MVDELYYEKNQLLLDEEGGLWILVDILESKSLLTKNSKPSFAAFIKKKTLKKDEKAKIIKVNFKKFSEIYTPFLHTDKQTVDKILSLEDLLHFDAIHPIKDEN